MKLRLCVSVCSYYSSSSTFDLTIRLFHCKWNTSQGSKWRLKHLSFSLSFVRTSFSSFPSSPSSSSSSFSSLPLFCVGGNFLTHKVNYSLRIIRSSHFICTGRRRGHIWHFTMRECTWSVSSEWMWLDYIFSFINICRLVSRDCCIHFRLPFVTLNVRRKVIRNLCSLLLQYQVFWVLSVELCIFVGK